MQFKLDLFTFVACLLSLFFITSRPVLAASLILDPASDTFAKGDEFTTDIILDAQGDDIVATDVIIDYDSQKLEVLDASLTNVFTAKVANGTIRNNQVIFSASSLNPVTGKQTIAKINFKVLASSGAAKVSIVNNDSTDTSLVVKTGGVKVLSKVVDAVYTIGNKGIGGVSDNASDYSNNKTTSTKNTNYHKTTNLPKAGSEKLTVVILALGLGIFILGIRSKFA